MQEFIFTFAWWEEGVGGVDRTGRLGKEVYLVAVVPTKLYPLPGLNPPSLVNMNLHP